VAGTCKGSNEPLGSIKHGEFLDKLRTGQLLKDSATWSKEVSRKVVSYQCFRTAYRSHLTLEDGMDSLSQNFGVELPFLSVSSPKILEISFTWRWKPEIVRAPTLYYFITSIQSIMVFHFIGSILC
jgi:hypothetical protein